MRSGNDTNSLVGRNAESDIAMGSQTGGTTDSERVDRRTMYRQVLARIGVCTGPEDTRCMTVRQYI